MYLNPFKDKQFENSYIASAVYEYIRKNTVLFESFQVLTVFFGKFLGFHCFVLKFSDFEFLV
jgi:hypothetical protein